MSDVEVALLGPLELTVAGAPTAVRGPKQAAVLAVLAVESAPVPADRLAEIVWDREADDRLTHSLQQHVSELRKLIEPSRAGRDRSQVLRLGPGGYELVASVDIGAFERLASSAELALSDGREAEASELLDLSLALWRGPALADVRQGPWFDSAAARVEERRSHVVEVRVDVLLDQGRHRELVGELEELVAATPFREQLWSRLMLALYRSGRQADALGAYRRARSALVDELGIEPGPELRRLEQRVLAQDPGLEHVGRSPTAPPGELRSTHRTGSSAVGGSLVLPDGQVVHLGPGRHVVGRQPGSDVLLTDSRVSRDHAEVLVVDGRVEVRDLGSTNGTTVDGAAVDRAELVGGEVLSFGGVELAYSADEDPD